MEYLSRKERQWAREYYGAEKIRVDSNGDVSATGSNDPTDRSKDWWRYLGTADEVRAEMARDNELY